MEQLKLDSNNTWRINGSRVGFGLGSIQWSFSRTLSLVNVYLEKNNNSNIITKSQAIEAEADMIMRELNTSYNTIVTEWKNTCDNLNSSNAANLAGAIICKKYLIPYETDKQVQKRAPVAEKIFLQMML